MKILLIKRGAIGDLLMTTPLIRQLKTTNSQAQIEFSVARSCAMALHANPFIDNLIQLGDEIFSSKNPWLMVKYILTIRHQYDYIFILGKNWLVNCLFKFSGAQLVGFAREKNSRLILNKYVVYNDVKRYQSLYYLDLLNASGLASANYSDISLDVVISHQDKHYIDLLLSQNALSEFVVVTNSGGNNQFDQGYGERMLPEPKLQELLNKLLKDHLVILLGAAVDKLNYDRYQASLGYPKNLLNFAGKLSIAQSCQLLTKASHFYVTDCGAMHLGIAAGISERMTCFFGPTNPAHILPSTSHCRVIWQDQDIFDANYQLYGTINQREFFKKLEINAFV